MVFFVPFLTNPGSISPQNSNCTAAYLHLKKHQRNTKTCGRSKDEPRNTRHVGEARTNPETTFFYGPWKSIGYGFVLAFTYGRGSVGWPARTDLPQLWSDTGCSLEDLPRAMDDRDGQRERGRGVREICIDDDKKEEYLPFCSINTLSVSFIEQKCIALSNRDIELSAASLLDTL